MVQSTKHSRNIKLQPFLTDEQLFEKAVKKDKEVKLPKQPSYQRREVVKSKLWRNPLFQVSLQINLPNIDLRQSCDLKNNDHWDEKNEEDDSHLNNLEQDLSDLNEYIKLKFRSPQQTSKKFYE